MDINMQSSMPEPEHDDEGKMAKADLYKTAKYSLKLFKMMEDNAQLEGWVQAKITKAADYLASVYHYLEYEMKFTEYGRAIEDSEMYSESEKKILRNKLLEAKEKVKDLKKVQAEKLKEKEKKKVDESEDDRGGDDDTKSDFNKIKTSSGHTRHSRKSSRAKADHELHGDVPVTSLHPDHDERAAKFLAKQVRGNKVSPMDQLTKRKGMSDLDEAKAKKAKKDYDGDGEVESGKDEVIGSRRKAAGLPFKEDGATAPPSKDKTGQYPMITSGPNKGKRWTPEAPGPTTPGFKEAAEKKCNHTAKGKSCPVHGMKECSGMREEQEKTMSRAAKGVMKYGKDGMKALAQAGKDGKDLDKVRNKYNKYDEATEPKDLPTKGTKMGKEGNAFGKAVQDAKASGDKTVTVGGKTMPVKETSKPSAGMSKGEKSAVVKKAKAGGDIGKPGKSFEKVAKAAGGGEKGTKIAAAAMWKNQAK